MFDYYVSPLLPGAFLEQKSIHPMYLALTNLICSQKNLSRGPWISGLAVPMVPAQQKLLESGKGTGGGRHMCLKTTSSKLLNCLSYLPWAKRNSPILNKIRFMKIDVYLRG